MLSIVITAFKEPNIGKAIEAILKNNIKEEYELIVATPDEETANIVKKFAEINKKIKYFKDPGKGKSFALNLIFKILRGDIWIFTKGNVYISENAIKEITDKFKDPLVGCVTGRPISLNSKNNMLGFWSHLLYNAGAHNIRKKLDSQNEFLECSDYLFAFRKNITKNTPLNIAEDTIIPYLTTKKGYTVKYAENALVYVKNPTNIREFIQQRIRTAKAHKNLEEYAPFFPKVKSFKNEIIKGTLPALKYPKTPKEVIWTLNLFLIRLYIWLIAM